MHVMQVTYSLVAGGSERIALQLASHLRHLGHEASICAIVKGGPVEAELKAAGIPFAIMHRSCGVRPPLTGRLYNLFRSRRIDVLHVHHVSVLTSLLPAARLAGIPRLICTEHYVDRFIAYPRERLEARVAYWFVDVATAVTDDVATYLRHHVGVPRRKLRLIRNGVDLRRFSQRGRRGQWKRRLGFSEHRPLVGIIARLDAEKNHRLLLDAAVRMKPHFPGLSVLIAGEGDLYDDLVRAVAERALSDTVHFMGVRHDIPELLWALDAFVLCSLREGLPLTILEAMAAGTPVVATRVGGIPDALDDGATGILTRAGDPEDLARALASVLSDRALAERLSHSARQIAEKKFSLQRMLSQYLSLYDSLTGVTSGTWRPMPIYRA